MRIHRIDIEGFGPFRERQSIDIDDVAADGLFLIAGPTGAGKSSILDAVSFALYDAVPRYDGDISRVRSDHSKPAEPSEVRLEFSMGGDRYRVTRSPKYLRPAKRGGGTTEQPSTAQLERWTGAHWQGIAARPVDVAAELAPILVLSKDQFQQVILLAQNRFQRFLHAKDQERQALLRTLFRTERFEHIEQAFAERRRALAGEHDRLLADGEARRERLDAALHEGERLAAASAPRAETPADALIDADAAADGTADPTAEPTPDPARPDPPLAPPETEDAAITRALTTLTQHASAAHALAAEREQAERAAEAALSRAEHAARAQHRRDRALAEHRELDAATPLITAEEAALSAAAQAEAIRPARERSARAAAERAAAQTRLDAALAARHAAAIAASPEDALLTAEDTSQDPEDTNAPRVPDSADLDAEETRLNAQIEALAVAAAAELRLSGHRATRAKRTADADELDAALDALRAEREQLPAQLVRQRDALSQSEREAAGLPAARLARSAAEAEQRARREAAEHRERLAAAQRRVAEAAREASRAGAEFSRLVTARLDGFAAELAADLAEGHPCPVCGSAEHPAPAPTTADPVGQERIDEADALRLRLDAALTREREAEQEARLALADADARSGEGDDAALGRRLDAARADLGLAQAAEARIPEERAAIERSDAARAETAARIEALLGARDTARAEAASAHTRAQEDEGVAEAARGDFPSVAARDAALRELRQAVARARQQVLDLGRADAEAAQALRERDAALAESPFADEAAAQAALLTPEAREAREIRVAQHRSDEARVRAILAEPELADLPETPADTEGARGLREAARAERERAATAAAELARVAREADARAAEYRAARESAGERAAELDRLRQLADAVEGKEPNTRRMRLETFVLAARLEAIIAAANTRLSRMVHGRYRLQHDDDLQYRGRQSGLGIRVLDEHTGRARTTDSLSGGETFLASLALALGLADVVTAEAGGVTLDTLFVDEGFGSLDPEALAEAMATLDSLREGGRAVALISHVTEMREQVPAQIEVRVQPDGTSRILSPGSAPQTAPGRADPVA